jgi:hypothetical protein
MADLIFHYMTAPGARRGAVTALSKRVSTTEVAVRAMPRIPYADPASITDPEMRGHLSLKELCRVIKTHGIGHGEVLADKATARADRNS